MTTVNAVPDVVWTHVVSFLSLPISSGSVGIADCRDFQRLALVSKALCLATRAQRQRHKRCVCVIALTNACTSFSTANSHDVYILVLGARKSPRLYWRSYNDDPEPQPVDWLALLTPFANIVRLDLSCMRNARAPEILGAASRLCRHVRALALPDWDPHTTMWQHAIEGLFQPATTAMSRWREANGGLRYLSLGQLADNSTDGPRVLELLGDVCPSLEVLVCPGTTILRRKWTTAWTAFWRTCRNLRQSNCPFPVCTRADLDQFAVVPKPQLTHLCLYGFNFAWAVDDAVAMAVFGRTVPSLQCLRLEVRPRRRVQPIDVVICHALTQCPRLALVTVVAASPRPRDGGWRRPPPPGLDIALVTPRGVLALAGCRSVQRIHIERVAIDINTLGAMVKRTLESHVRRREFHLSVVHCDRDVLFAFLQFLTTLRSCALAHVHVKLRVTNLDWRVSLENRTCDELVVRDLVATVTSQHARDEAAAPAVVQFLRVRVDMRTPTADFVSDRSGFLVAAIAVDVGSRSALAEGVFADGHKVLA